MEIVEWPSASLAADALAQAEKERQPAFVEEVAVGADRVGLVSPRLETIPCPSRGLAVTE